MNSTQPAKFSLLQKIALLEDSADHDIMGGIKTVLDRIRTGWRSDYNDVTKKHNSAMKKLTDPERQKLISFVSKALDKLLDDVTIPVDVSPLLAVLYNSKETEAAYLMFSALSAGANEINRQFLQAAVADGYITQQEGEEKIKNVEAGKFENVGKNTVLKVKSNRDYLKQVLKVDPQSGLFDPNAGAQLLERGVNAAKQKGAKLEDIKASIASAYYALLMFRRQLGTASIALEQGASKRKPPKEPQPVGGTKPAGKPAAAPAVTVTSAGAAMAAPKPATSAQPVAAPAPAQPAAAPAAPAQGIDQETATEILTTAKQATVNGQRVADKPELIAKAVAMIKALPKGTSREDGEKIVLKRLLSGK
jgi:hypothetical protein